MMLAVLAVVVFGVIASYISLFLDSFIVPIMYKFNISTTAAWKHFIPWLSSHSGWFVLYGLFVLMLYIPFSVFFPMNAHVKESAFHTTYSLFISSCNTL